MTFLASLNFDLEKIFGIAEPVRICVSPAEPLHAHKNYIFQAFPYEIVHIM